MKITTSNLVRILLLCSLTSLLLFSGIFAAAIDAPLLDPTPNAPNLPWESNQQFLPIVRYENSTDLWIADLEITQGIQSLSNDVPLVEGRATAARVYADANGEDPLENVSVSISASRSGQALPGSPLVVGPATLPISWSRADINTSYNFELPTSWLSGDIDIDITVDSQNVYIEGNEDNNTVSMGISFTYVEPLNVTVIPVRYNDPYYGQFPPPNSDYLENDLLKMYPVSQVNISSHSSISFSQDLRNLNSWENLLDIITNYKTTEGKPDSEVYYGLIPMKNSYGYTWWSGGYIGLGWVGYRAAIGLTNFDPYGIDGGDTAAHEIGHNFGRWHSPCGDPGNVDPNYPYAYGTIGEFGFKVSNFKVIPNSRYDIMSYCDPAWVSDYTYEGLLADQMAVAAASAAQAKQAPQEVLLVRANLDLQGEPEIQPIYSFQGQPSLSAEDSPYSVEFLNEEGLLVASHKVDLLWIEESAIRVESISARILRPQQPFTSLRLVKEGKVLTEKNLPQFNQEKTNQPLLETSASENILCWGFSDIPALVRYSTDNGQIWTTLQVDHLGGELALDPKTIPVGELLFQINLADQKGTQFNLSWQNEG